MHQIMNWLEPRLWLKTVLFKSTQPHSKTGITNTTKLIWEIKRKRDKMKILKKELNNQVTLKPNSPPDKRIDILITELKNNSDQEEF